MNEKIVTEKAKFVENPQFSDFPKINELLNDGWKVKKWDIHVIPQPFELVVIAVLQKFK